MVFSFEVIWWNGEKMENLIYWKSYNLLSLLKRIISVVPSLSLMTQTVGSYVSSNGELTQIELKGPKSMLKSPLKVSSCLWVFSVLQKELMALTERRLKNLTIQAVVWTWIALQTHLHFFLKHRTQKIVIRHEEKIKSLIDSPYLQFHCMDILLDKSFCKNQTIK